MKTVTVNVPVEPRLKRLLEREAKLYGRTTAGIVRFAISEYFTKRDRQEEYERATR